MQPVDVEAPEGNRFDYHVVELAQIAVALIVNDLDQVLLLHKYRFPTDQWVPKWSQATPREIYFMIQTLGRQEPR